MDSFFGIGFPEFATILILAGIIMGPQRMGQVARWLGKTTAQLQAISRGFARQLSAELDSIDDGGEMKSALADIQDLRRQLTDLRGELRTQTTGVLQEGKDAIKEIERSILPPKLSNPLRLDNEAEAGEDVSKSENGASSAPQLPSPIDIQDDPE